MLKNRIAGILVMLAGYAAWVEVAKIIQRAFDSGPEVNVILMPLGTFGFLALAIAGSIALIVGVQMLVTGESPW